MENTNQPLEIWKDIVGYEGLYHVSNYGNIKSLNYNKTKKEKKLKPFLEKNGYLSVSLHKTNKAKTRLIHQLVAESFLNHKRCGFKLIVNHKNFIRHDNRLENLEIITQRENTNQKHLRSSSKYTGVSFSKRDKKYTAHIHVNKKMKYLGSFEDEKEASQYYENAVIAIKNGSEIKVKRKGFKGCYFNKRDNTWASCLKIDGKLKWLGNFKTEQEATNILTLTIKSNEKTTPTI